MFRSIRTIVFLPGAPIKSAKMSDLIQIELSPLSVKKCLSVKSAYKKKNIIPSVKISKKIIMEYQNLKILRTLMNEITKIVTFPRSLEHEQCDQPIDASSSICEEEPMEPVGDANDEPLQFDDVVKVVTQLQKVHKFIDSLIINYYQASLNVQEPAPVEESSDQAIQGNMFVTLNHLQNGDMQIANKQIQSEENHVNKKRRIIGDSDSNSSNTVLNIYNDNGVKSPINHKQTESGKRHFHHLDTNRVTNNQTEEKNATKVSQEESTKLANCKGAAAINQTHCPLAEYRNIGKENVANNQEYNSYVNQFIMYYTMKELGKINDDNKISENEPNAQELKKTESSNAVSVIVKNTFIEANQNADMQSTSYIDDNNIENVVSRRPQVPGIKEVILGANGTTIPRITFNKINWSKTGGAVTRQLLMNVFGRETLASHSLSGKPSPAFKGLNKPAKSALDCKKVKDIEEFMIKHFKMSSSEIRTAITTKCADETRNMRREAAKEAAKLNLNA